MADIKVRLEGCTEKMSYPQTYVRIWRPTVHNSYFSTELSTLSTDGPVDNAGILWISFELLRQPGFIVYVVYFFFACADTVL